MSTVLESPSPALVRRVTPAMWRVAGGLAIAHVVLVFAGFSQERSTTLTSGVGDARHAFAEGSLARMMAGGYVESLAFVILIPALVFVARTVGRRTELGRWAAQTSLAAGIGYVAITLATGLPAGAAAAYEGHHGGDLHTALMVANVRIFAFFLSLLVLSAQAIGLGVAALSDRFHRGWVGYGGVAVGVLLLLGVAGAGAGLHDFASMLWMVWWVGVGICLIRSAGRRDGEFAAKRSVTDAAASL